MLSEALEWILYYWSTCRYILHYMDDFLFIGALTSVQCRTLVARFLILCDETGVPLAPDEAEGLATTLTFLGIKIGDVKQTISLHSPNI